MPRHGVVSRTLPPYRQLRQEFESGMSLTVLAKKYNSTSRNISYKLRRLAPHFGDPWPIPACQSGSAEFERRHLEGIRRWVESDDFVNIMIIRDMIRDFLALSGVTQKQFAIRAGIPRSFISALIAGKYPHMRRERAELLFRTLETLETETGVYVDAEGEIAS